MKKMSKLWIETGKGPLYILGDDAVEIIVPPGLTIGTDCGPLPGQKLPDLPPIEYDMSKEEAEAIREGIVKSAELRLKLGAPPMEEM